MARTKAYMAEIKKDISKINYRLKGIEQTFGTASEQYKRYVNAITGSLPVGSYSLSPTGQIKISANKQNLQTLKTGQLRAPSRLPTAKQTIRQQKKELARYKSSQQGDEGEPVEWQDISDEEALNELNAKNFVKEYMDEHGGFYYTEEMKSDLSAKGKKSYENLQDIIRRGQRAKEEKRAKHREYSRRYYQRHREEILKRKREKRANS